MTHTDVPTHDALPAHAQLIQMGTAAFVTKTLYVAAKLGLADHLADGARSAVDLAAALGAHPDSLHRLMRTLAGLGVLTERAEGRFALTSLGRALESAAPGCARSTLITLGGAAFSAAFEHLEHAVRTGQTGFERAWGMPVFDYLAARPEEARLFSETMVGFHGAEPPAIAEAYDFSTLRSIVDVGGATGNLLAAILQRHTAPRGVLFDRPHVVVDAPTLLTAHGVASRVTIESGDFFQSVPAGGDAYLLSHIIHDWSEAQCLAILGRCREAMAANARLLIIEMVLPEGDAPHPGKLLDMVMLTVPGGRERTVREYAQLLERARFRVERVVPTASPVSIVEAFPV
jgi:O-methyltransferase domain/Dimerisation domain